MLPNKRGNVQAQGHLKYGQRINFMERSSVSASAARTKASTSGRERRVQGNGSGSVQHACERLRKDHCVYTEPVASDFVGRILGCVRHGGIESK